jgi:hypothetical protein
MLFVGCAALITYFKSFTSLSCHKKMPKMYLAIVFWLFSLANRPKTLIIDSLPVKSFLPSFETLVFKNRLFKLILFALPKDFAPQL